MSEGRFAIEIYKCRLAKNQPPLKGPSTLGGLLEIEVYFSYLDRIGLLKIVFV